MRLLEPWAEAGSTIQKAQGWAPVHARYRAQGVFRISRAKLQINVNEFIHTVDANGDVR